MLLKILLSTLAAFIAGNINAIAGGGAFITYPTLLILGNTGIIANATTGVVMWLGHVAAASGFKKEIVRNKSIKRFLLPVSIGSILGSFLLIHTPTKVFDIIVPFLIFFASLIFLYQKQIENFLSRKNSKYLSLHGVLGYSILILISIYGGYFGAGLGILLLAALSALGIKDIYEAIGMKIFLSLTINLIAIIYFIAAGIVNWQVVPFMAIGAMAGGFTGPKIARHVDKNIVRRGIVVYGFLIAMILFLHQMQLI